MLLLFSKNSASQSSRKDVEPYVQFIYKAFVSAIVSINVMSFCTKVVNVLDSAYRDRVFWAVTVNFESLMLQFSLF